MSLTMMVYLIGMLPALDRFLAIGCIINGVILSFYLLFHYLESMEKINKWFVGTMAAVVMVFSFINVLLPTEKTAYTMVAAYATQKVYESPETAKIQAKVLTIINQKLDTFIETTK